MLSEFCTLSENITSPTKFTKPRFGYRNRFQEQQQRKDTLLELIDIMVEQGILNQVSEIDLTNPLWIGLVYRQNFQVRLPQGDDHTRSIRLMVAAVEDTVQSRGEQCSGVMDLTQQGFDAIFTPANP